MIATLVAIGVVVLIITGAIVKIVIEKKKGVKCIGCPVAHDCAKRKRAACNESNRYAKDKYNIS